MEIETFDSVWDAIEDTPGEAEVMRLRSLLMIAATSHIKFQKLSHTKAAKLFGVTSPRLSDLKRGKIDLFDLEALVGMLATAGLRFELRIADPHRVFGPGETPEPIAGLFAKELEHLIGDDDAEKSPEHDLGS